MEFLALLKDSSIPTIFVVVGIMLMFISLGIKPSSKFIKININYKFSSILSILFIIIGVIIQVAPSINKINHTEKTTMLRISKLKLHADNDLKDKNYDGAIEKLREVLIYTPNDIVSLEKISKTYNSIKQYKLALESIKKAISLNPKNGDFYLLQCRIYGNNKDYKNSIESCNKALPLVQCKDEVLDLLSFYYRKIGKYELSLKFRNKRINSNVYLSENYLGYDYFHKAIIYEEMADQEKKKKEKIELYGKSINNYKECLKLSPKDTQYYKQAGIGINRVGEKVDKI